MKTWTVIGVAVGLIATGALAHQGVQNPAVKAWMNAMEAIGQNTKVLGTMAKGETAFEADVARAAAAAIAEKSVLTPELFAVQEDDPKSEALPAIWENFADFTAKAEELTTVAETASGAISTPEDLQSALAAIGATCKSCHQLYRE